MTNDDDMRNLDIALWAEMMDALERDLPVANYEVERLRARLAPVLETMFTGTMH